MLKLSENIIDCMVATAVLPGESCNSTIGEIMYYNASPKFFAPTVKLVNVGAITKTVSVILDVALE